MWSPTFVNRCSNLFNKKVGIVEASVIHSQTGVNKRAERAISSGKVTLDEELFKFYSY